MIFVFFVKTFQELPELKNLPDFSAKEWLAETKFFITLEDGQLPPAYFPLSSFDAF